MENNFKQIARLEISTPCRDRIKTLMTVMRKGECEIDARGRFWFKFIFGVYFKPWIA